MNDPREDTVDAYLGLGGPPANDNEPHIGMNGKPCRCTPERRAQLAALARIPGLMHNEGGRPSEAAAQIVLDYALGNKRRE